MSDYSGFKSKRVHALGAVTSIHEATSDTRAGRFALKIFHPEPSTSVKRLYAIEGFLLAAEKQQLAAKAASGKGVSVTEVVAFGRCDEGAFIVTPWQDRPLEPLVDTLTPKGDLLRAVAECLLDALARWEAQTGAPHGKLKSTNVFLEGDSLAAGLTAKLTDPAFLPGVRPDTLRARDLAMVGTLLVQIVRKRVPSGFPIEEAPEWTRLGRPGKHWLAYCNYLTDPQGAGTHTIEEARKRLRKVPADPKPVRTAILSTAGVAAMAAAGIAAWAKYGDPESMPRSIGRLAVTLHNVRIPQEVTPAWAQLCRAWETWLPDLQNNAERLEKTPALWNGDNDPLKLALRDFITTAASLQPGTVVPKAASEKRLGVLASAPPPEVRNELLVARTHTDVVIAMQRLTKLQLTLETWPRWNELRDLLGVLEQNRFSRAADALRPKLATPVDPVVSKQDAAGVTKELTPERTENRAAIEIAMERSATRWPELARTQKLLNDISLDDTGTLLLASRWSEFFAVKKEMETSTDRVQAAMPQIILAKLTDSSSIGTFADSLAEPLTEVTRRRKRFLEPQVVRERFLKESPLQSETAPVTEADFPRWEAELDQFSKVPATEDPRRAPELDATTARLTNEAVDLEAEAPTPEPGGLPTLSTATFQTEFKTVATDLGALRAQEIVRRDLPEISAKTTSLGDALKLLGQRLEATLALLKPDIWLRKANEAYGKFEATRQRWAAWQQAALTGVTARDLDGRPNREKFRGLRAQARTLRDWIDGFEGEKGFGALPPQAEVGEATPDTRTAVLALEHLRREQAATAVAAAAAWNGPLPTLKWDDEPDPVRAPLEAHKRWLSRTAELASDLDRLGQSLAEGRTWTDGVADDEEKLARYEGIDALTGKPAGWHADAKELHALAQTDDRAKLEQAARSGKISFELAAWRRYGGLAGWPSGPAELDVDGSIVESLRKLIATELKDIARRESLVGERGELTLETRTRWNRAARNSAKNEKDLVAVFSRMEKYKIGENDLEGPNRYNFTLWQLKQADWGETDLKILKTRRDTFLEKVRAGAEVASLPVVSSFTQQLESIDLKDDPNRKPTPSPRMNGWVEKFEEQSDSDKAANKFPGLVATWTGTVNNRPVSVQLEFSLIQPEDDSTAPFYLSRQAISVGDFIKLVNGRREDGQAVMAALQDWARDPKAAIYEQNRAMSWVPTDDYKGVKLNEEGSWLHARTALIEGLFNSDDALNAATARGPGARDAILQLRKEKPELGSPLQQISPGAAKVFAERMVGARLPTPKDWAVIVKQHGTNPPANLRGPRFRDLLAFVDTYRSPSAPEVSLGWRPTDKIFQPKAAPGDQSQVPKDDGQPASETDEGLLWPTPVGVGPVIDKFVNLFGNVCIYLYDEATKSYYITGGSAESNPKFDIKQPYKIEASRGAIGSKVGKEPTESYDDVGLRVAFDAPFGFRERYKLLMLVRKQAYLTL